MEEKRRDNLGDLRRQRRRLRRISVGVLVAAGVFAISSCEGLTRRDAASQAPAATSQSTLQNTALGGGAPRKRPS